MFLNRLSAAATVLIVVAALATGGKRVGMAGKGATRCGRIESGQAASNETC